MTRRTCRSLLITLFFLQMVVAIVWINAKRPRILVMHSYNMDYVWTRDVDVGLQRVLNVQSWIAVRYHYMNTYRESNPERLRRAGIAARQAIDDYRPNVVILVDDNAQELAGKYYVHDPSLKIVFAGVNGAVTPYGYDNAPNVTGIVERKPVAAIKEVITLLSRSMGKNLERGDKIRALMFVDTTLSTLRDAEYVGSFDWKPISYLGMRRFADFESWKTAILQLGQQTDFLLVGGYRNLRRRLDSGSDEPFVPAAEVMEWTQKNAAAIVIGTNFFNTEDGAMLSVGVSPYEQGETAAALARKIIEQKVIPQSIPVQTSTQYLVACRKSTLAGRRVEIPHILEAFARATDNYFE
jgi:hypothetical protein